ncbi:hypothetical protein H8356DRAFT_1344869 [Neocallimastix lanati (nom. inval.)]|nr:hypothetical protein H8356DRAFT_1344869 [Neocallimastix sp. JGI-2020a]
MQPGEKQLGEMQPGEMQFGEMQLSLRRGVSIKIYYSSFGLGLSALFYKVWYNSRLGSSFFNFRLNNKNIIENHLNSRGIKVNYNNNNMDYLKILSELVIPIFNTSVLARILKQNGKEPNEKTGGPIFLSSQVADKDNQSYNPSIIYE